MSKKNPISADFTDVKTIPSRSLLRLIFDVPIEMADEVLSSLGGIPMPGESRVCGIVLLEK